MKPDLRCEFVEEIPKIIKKKASVFERLTIKEKAQTIVLLAARSGTWALIQKNVSVSSVEQWKSLGCEVVLRNCFNNKGDVYARWPDKS